MTAVRPAGSVPGCRAFNDKNDDAGTQGWHMSCKGKGGNLNVEILDSVCGYQAAYLSRLRVEIRYTIVPSSVV